MSLSLTTYLIACPLVFLAGFIDSIAGGGGLLSLPAYLLAGIPFHLAYGTNKFANGFGTAMASFQFAKKRHVIWRTALISSCGALVGAWTGARLALLIDENLLRLLLVALLPCIALFLLKNRSFDLDEPKRPSFSLLRPSFVAALIGLVCGGYDGFLGPGTGTFIIIAYTSFMNLPLLNASANAKIINLASNIAALTAFLLDGAVLFSVAVPCAACSIAGNLIGSKLAIKNGARFIKPVILFVIILLFLRICFDLFFVS